MGLGRAFFSTSILQNSYRAPEAARIRGDPPSTWVNLGVHFCSYFRRCSAYLNEGRWLKAKNLKASLNNPKYIYLNIIDIENCHSSAHDKKDLEMPRNFHDIVL